jgi:hypothetical protein
MYSSHAKRHDAQPTRGEAIKYLEMYKAMHAEPPCMTRYIMSGGPTSRGPVTGLFPLGKTLMSSKTESEFISAMREMDYMRGGISDEALGAFWKNRSQAPIWLARAEKMYADWHKTNLNLEEAYEIVGEVMETAKNAADFIRIIKKDHPGVPRKIIKKIKHLAPTTAEVSGWFADEELRAFYNDRDNPDGWKPKPPPSEPPYRRGLELHQAIEAALAQSKTFDELFKELRADPLNWKMSDGHIRIIWNNKDAPENWKCYFSL